jgi:hypothetical protein
MRRLASIAFLGTMTLLSSIALSQVRGSMGGGGGRSSGGGGGVRMSSPAPHVSAGRPVGSGFSSGPAFRTAPVGRPTFSRGPFSRGPFPPARVPGVATNHFTAQNRVFFSGHDHRFHSGFFHHHVGFNNGFFGANCFGTFAFGNPFCGGFSTAFFFGDPFFSLGFGYPGYGYGYGYGYYPSYASSPSPDYYPPQSSGSSDNGNEVALTAEIQHLSDEIQDLRDERRRDEQTQDRQAASSGATLSAVPPSANTIFVLRDGRRIMAKNYAISGQTLWILNENTARKTPLSDIDRVATEQANAANGIEIHLPEAK